MTCILRSAAAPRTRMINGNWVYTEAEMEDKVNTFVLQLPHVRESLLTSPYRVVHQVEHYLWLRSEKKSVILYILWYLNAIPNLISTKRSVQPDGPPYSVWCSVFITASLSAKAPKSCFRGNYKWRWTGTSRRLYHLTSLCTNYSSKIYWRSLSACHSFQDLNMY